VSVHPSATVTPGVVVYRLDDRLFFANASYFKSRVREAIHGAPTATAWLVLDAEAIVAIDASGVEALEQLVESLAQQGITLVVARIKSPLQAHFDSTGLTGRIGADHFYPTVAAAVAACGGS
jgi:sulfate permease, SulP family